MSTEPTPQDRFYAIAEQGLCIGCGLCQAVAGPDKVAVTKTTTGYERPIVVGDLDHDTVDKIYDICPGTRIEGLPEALIDDRTKHDNVWGPWRRMVRAWASDPQVRFEAATGGVLSSLSLFLLSSRRVDFILHAKASTSEPTFGERHLSFTQAQVMAGAGSRYGPTAPLVDVTHILDRDQPFAFIGKPCDIAALRNYARHDPRVNRLVKYYLTPVCGGFAPPPFTENFIRRSGFNPAEVTAFRYRGRGCPGPHRIETPERALEVHYLDFWGEDESQWSLPFRCKICPDGIGEAADIAAADSWPGGSPSREDSESDPGTNAVVVRTAAGVELMEAAEAAGALTIEYDVTPDEMSHYQPHQMRKKYSVWARHQGLADEGRIVPKTARLRIQDLADELPAATNDYQRQGTRRRVREGKVQEPRPAVATKT
ncbi:MAG: Coenzyme F420 hydrogenase/dehydrogenase, beta subunit C-terminal domain [Pseudomonadota bacterium]